MERNIIPEEELISILNKELSKYEECENCRINGVIKLAEEDRDGCNWSRAGVKLHCSGGGVGICESFASKVIYKVGEKYNVEK